MGDNIGGVGVSAPRPAQGESFLGKLAHAAETVAAKSLEVGYELADAFLPAPVKDFGLTLAEGGVDVLSGLSNVVTGKDSKASQVLSDLGRVDLEGIRRDDHLSADWFGMTKTWFFEQKPEGLGTWSKDPDGTDRVTITREDFTSDLAKKPAHAQALEKLRREFPEPKVGDAISTTFSFTGPGSASGKYDALEWALGSYQTTVRVESIDRATGKVHVKCQVENASGWQSATRMPQTFQDKGLPAQLIDDTKRDQHELGGNYRQTFAWEEDLDLADFAQGGAAPVAPKPVHAPKPAPVKDEGDGPKAGERYTARDGDTLWSLAEALSAQGVPGTPAHIVEVIQALNPSTDGAEPVRTGDTLKLPAALRGSVSWERSDDSNLDAEANPTGEPTTPARAPSSSVKAGERYTAKDGDTLWSIAEALQTQGVPGSVPHIVEVLEGLNPTTEGGSLPVKTGDTLKLPAARSDVVSWS